MVDPLSYFLFQPVSGSMVECLLMVQWVNGSIPDGGAIELFLVPASFPPLV